MDTETLSATEVEVYTNEPYKLVLHNDNHNSFEHVIYCLMTYLLKTPEEAFIIANTVHTMGREIIFGSSSREEVFSIYKILLIENLTVSVH